VSRGPDLNNDQVRAAARVLYDRLSRERQDEQEPEEVPPSDSPQLSRVGCGATHGSGRADRAPRSAPAHCWSTPT
jgi:hypothetical protein